MGGGITHVGSWWGAGNHPKCDQKELVNALACNIVLNGTTCTNANCNRFGTEWRSCGWDGTS
eukprot:3708967-Amphidinium_carterae.1